MIAPLDDSIPIVVRETLSGVPGIVDLWCFFLEDADELEVRSGYHELLCDGERARCGRYHREVDRFLYVATRMLARTVLSEYAGVDPGEWGFASGTHGKPHIASPSIESPLHFNLSNTSGLVTCAVSVSHASLGTDAEHLGRVREVEEVVHRCCSPRELAALGAMSPSSRRERLLWHWTLKESYVKARGLGLAIPLDQVSFVIDCGAEVGVMFDPRRGEDAADWRFAVLNAPPDHVIAVGARTGGFRMSLRAVRATPRRVGGQWRAVQIPRRVGGDPPRDGVFPL